MSNGEHSREGPDGSLRGELIELGRPRARRRFFFLGILLAVALGLYLYVVFTPTTSGGPIAAGAAVPHFTLANVEGGPKVGTPIDGGGDGRPVVLVFFAATCTICHTELPQLAKVVRVQRYEGGKLSKLSVLGIDTLDTPSTGAAFARSSGVTFPVGSDDDATILSNAFGYLGDPYVVFVKADGIVAVVHPGAMTPASFTAQEERLVRGS
jgi:peroxiredoxin